MVQLALAISKITRFDFPEPWTEFYPFMLQTLLQGDEFTRERALFIIGQFAKEQTTKRVGHSVESFKRVTKESLNMMCQLWTFYASKMEQELNAFVMTMNQTNNTTNNTTTIATNTTTATTSIQVSAATRQLFKNCLNTTKIIRRMIVGGITNLDDQPIALQFLEHVWQYVVKFYAIRQEICHKMSNQNESEMATLVHKCLGSFMKIPLRAQNKHLLQMRTVLTPYLQFCLKVIFECDLSKTDAMDMFMFRCLMFVKNVAETTKYNGDSDAARHAKELIKVQFFTEQVLSSLITQLISKYMLLTKEELDQWEDDPELFVRDQEMDFSGSIKNASELLFISLVETYDETLPTYMANYSSNLLKETYGSLDQDKLLLRDAVYNAMGWVSHYLCQNIDFSTFFKQMLSQEIQMRDPRYKIIRRRAVWLIGRWADAIKNDIISDVFRCLLYVLSEEDTVLKLSSLMSLKELLDEDRDVSNKVLQEFLDPFVKSVFQLLSQVEEEETKVALLHLLSIFIERMHRVILPYVPTLMQYVPALWNQSNDEHMIRNSIIVALTKLVDTMGEDSVSIHNFVLPLIKYATDIDGADHLYYIEDGLQLWQSTMHQAPQCSDALLDLFPNIPKSLNEGFENIIISLKITESYVLLGRDQFLNRFGSLLNEFCFSIAGEVKDKPMIICLSMMETVLTLFPDQGPQVLQAVLQKLLIALFKGTESVMARSHIVSLFARIVATNRQGIMQHLLNEVAKQLPGGATPDALFMQMVKIWVDGTEDMIATYKRKVSVVGLLTLFPSQNNELMNDIFGILVNLCVQVLFEDAVIEECGLDQLGTGDDAVRNEYDRKRLQMKNDPIMHADVYQILMTKFEQIAAMMGSQQAFEQFLTSKVDSTVLTQLSKIQQTRQQQLANQQVRS